MTKLQQSKLKRDAQIAHGRKLMEIEVAKAKKLADIEVSKFKTTVDALGSYVGRWNIGPLAVLLSFTMTMAMGVFLCVFYTGRETIAAMARAGPEMQAKLLQGLGLKGFLLTDGKNPINLFNAAQGMVAQ